MLAVYVEISKLGVRVTVQWPYYITKYNDEEEKNEGYDDTRAIVEK